METGAPKPLFRVVNDIGGPKTDPRCWFVFLAVTAVTSILFAAYYGLHASHGRSLGGHPTSVSWVDGLILGSLCGAILGWAAYAIAAPFLQTWPNVSALKDSAHWATEAELREKGFFGEAGPIIGTHLGKLLRYGGERGVEFIAPPGRRKSVWAMANLLSALVDSAAKTWTEDRRLNAFWGYEPLVIALDIKSELYEASSKFQRETLGKNILRVAPLGTQDGLARWNPCWEIRLGTDHEEGDARRLASNIVDEHGQRNATVNDSHWLETARGLGTACILKLGYRSLQNPEGERIVLRGGVGGKEWKGPEYSSFSLPGVARYVSSFGSVKGLVESLLTCDDPHEVFRFQTVTIHKKIYVGVHPTVAEEAAKLLVLFESKDGGASVLSSLTKAFGIYRDPIVVKNVSDSTFSLRADLAQGERPAALYLTVPSTKLDDLRPYIRVLIRTAFAELTAKESSGTRYARPSVRSTVLLLDEVAQLGRLHELANSGAVVRGHGVSVWTCWQTHEQRTEVYGQNTSLKVTSGVHIYATPEQGSSESEAVRRMLGRTTRIIRQRNPSGKPSYIADTRDLFSSSEIENLPNDESIVFSDGLRIRAKKHDILDPEDETLVSPEFKVLMGPVDSSDVLRSEPQFVTDLRALLAPERFDLLSSPVPVNVTQEQVALPLPASEPQQHASDSNSQPRGRTRRRDTLRSS